MTALVYDTAAPKKPTNLTVNSDLLRKAKERKINVSSVLEAALVEELRNREIEEWKEVNAQSIDQYNKKVAAVGLFSEGLRTF